MLSEARKALRITTTAYDTELASLLRAAARDLEVSGVLVPGGVDITFDGSTATDLSTIDDALVQRAMITYVRLHFGTPPDYDRLAESYHEQKASLMHAAEYTYYGE